MRGVGVYMGACTRALTSGRQEGMLGGSDRARLVSIREEGRHAGCTPRCNNCVQDGTRVITEAGAVLKSSTHKLWPSLASMPARKQAAQCEFHILEPSQANRVL